MSTHIFSSCGKWIVRIIARLWRRPVPLIDDEPWDYADGGVDDDTPTEVEAERIQNPAGIRSDLL